jgi:FkbM family methyltransferase
MEYTLAHGEGETTIDGHIIHYSSFNLLWLNRPRVILDVGAYDFGDSIRMKKRFPDCEVHAFELLPKNYDKFAPFANSCGVITYRVGISDVIGISEYYEATCATGVDAQSTLLEPAQAYRNNYSHIVSHEKSQSTTDTTTIEEICKQAGITEIDLLHIDVEGAELQVIKGLGPLRPTLIFAEFLLCGEGWIGQAPFEETMKYMDSIGYDCVGTFPHDRLFKLR